MALPVRHNIDAYPDTTASRKFHWVAGGADVDLTGWTGRLRIGRAGKFLMEVPDAVTLGGTAGTVTLHIPAGTLTATGSYWYVLDLLDPSSEPTRLVNGTLRMLGVYA